jgi:hypothetical protein
MTIRGAMRVRGGFFAILALLCLVIAVIAVGQSQSGGDNAELAASDELLVAGEEGHDHGADGHAHGEGDDHDHADGDHAHDSSDPSHSHADGDHAHDSSDPSHSHTDGDHAHNADDPNHAHSADDPNHAHNPDDPTHPHNPDVPHNPDDPTHPHPPTPPAIVYTQAQLDLLRATQAAIYPRFATTAAAEAAGYRSIGDAATGFEHYVNRTYLTSSDILDPATIESLVYQVGPGNTRTLVSGMYILPLGQTLSDVPTAFDTAQTPWHIHTNLCWSLAGGGFRVVGITDPNNPSCPPGSIYFITPPMLHVWVNEQKCGWFSDLEQVGSGDCNAHPH